MKCEEHPYEGLMCQKCGETAFRQEEEEREKAEAEKERLEVLGLELVTIKEEWKAKAQSLADTVAVLATGNEKLKKALKEATYVPKQRPGSPQAMADEVIFLRAENEQLREGLQAVENLIKASQGVYGLRFHNDPEPWAELRTGGQFEEWLIGFDKACTQEEE
jgi:hypothetical protein